MEVNLFQKLSLISLTCMVSYIAVLALILPNKTAWLNGNTVTY
jgi:hypothetical protein